MGLLSFARDERGNMSILFGVAMMLGAVVAAFAIDEASLNGERRAAQAAVDLASIEASRNLGAAYDTARKVLVDAGLIAPSITVAELTNAVSTTRLEVVTGRYVADPALAPTARFVVGQSPPNAARVRFHQEGTLYFARAWSDPPVIGVEAVSSTTPQVSFSVGSRLVRLKDGVANAVLSSLLGTKVTLDAVSYNALVDTDVSLFSFLDALANRIGISAGTYEDVLKASASRGAIASALADVLNGTARTAAQALAAISGNDTVKLGNLIDLGLYGGMGLGTAKTNGLMTNVSVMEMLAMSAALADGSHQVALNIGANVPGLVGITTTLVIGEPQQGGGWYAVGPRGETIRTAQVRLRLVANLLGGPLLLGAGVRVPLYLDLAYAEASVASANCPTGSSGYGSAVIDTRPGVARLILGEVSDAGLANLSANPQVKSAKLIDLLVLKVSALADVDAGSVKATALSFSSADIAARKVRTASSSGLVTSLTQSLVNNLELDVDILGIGLGTSSAIKGAVRALITPVAPVLDSTIETVLNVLGLSLGQADVQVYGVRCSQPVLVR